MCRIWYYGLGLRENQDIRKKEGTRFIVGSCLNHFYHPVWSGIEVLVEIFSLKSSWCLPVDGWHWEKRLGEFLTSGHIVS